MSVIIAGQPYLSAILGPVLPGNVTTTAAPTTTAEATTTAAPTTTAAATTTAAVPDYVVSGAGTSDANGDYFRVADHNGKPCYQNSAGSVMYRNSSYWQWYINSEFNESNAWYYNPGSILAPESPYLPTDGSWGASLGANPPPTVVAGG